MEDLSLLESRLYQLMFIQIRLFININNFCKAVDYSQRVLRHMRSNPAFSLSLVKRIEGLAITSRITGFSVSDYPLWALGCLLDENWLEEDVLNSLLELLYFQLAAESVNPPVIILPTSFFNDAKRLFAQSPRHYSPNMIALRDRLCVATPRALSAVACIGGHFSGYFSYQNGPLEHGDSMGLLAAPKLLPILIWVFAGLETAFIMPHSVHEARVSRQGLASGSCGIAALNFIMSNANSKAPNWSNETSPQFWDDALLKLLVYHFAAVDNEGVRYLD